MKRICSLFGLLLLSVYSFSQNAIKIGMKACASSLTTNNDYKIFHQNKWAINPSIAIDYLSHKYYYLNSEICLANIGGKDYVHRDEAENPIQKMEVDWKYVEANTKFRLQFPMTNMSLYAGAGLFARSRISSASSTYYQDYAYKGNNFLYGEIFEGGITTTLGNIKADFNIYYYLKNNNVAKSGELKFYPKTWGVGLSFGYIL